MVSSWFWKIDAQVLVTKLAIGDKRARGGSVKCSQLPFLREDARIEKSICKTNGQDLLQIE